jgi:leader peptidase (prepilin peptidase)/N-methyltransferase
MTALAAAVGAGVGAFGGGLVPVLVRLMPEPEPSPHERPEDFPAKIPYAELALTPHLADRCLMAGALAGALLGSAIGWDWPLAWLLFLVPVCCALSVIDWTTWYLPSRLIYPSFAVVAALVAIGALATGDWHPLLGAAIGQAALGGYYGLLWLISPRLMAFGDVRLGWLLGLALGPLGVTAVVGSAVGAGLIGALALLPMRRRGVMIGRHAPFGPFLVAGALLAVVVDGLLG